MVYVVWYNEYGCELDRSEHEDMERAAAHVMDMCRHKNKLQAGDLIKFEEID